MRRDKEIHIRMSDAELKEIYERMDILGIKNFSSYMRLMGRKGVINNIDMSGFDEAIRLMRINSNNLNQYAKKANENGNIYKKEIDLLAEQHEEIYEVLKVILDKLSILEGK